MSTLRLLSLALATLSAVSATALKARVLPVRELELRTIPALLRSSGVTARSAEGLLLRQSDTCDVGYLPCSDGNGCCPDDEYCGVWGGKLGCCPNGETCVANPNQQCDYENYSLCPSGTFCCPDGDTCSTASDGSPQCLSPGGGNGGGAGGTLGATTNLNTNTNTLFTHTTSSIQQFTTHIQQTTITTGSSSNTGLSQPDKVNSASTVQLNTAFVLSGLLLNALLFH